MTRDLTDQKGWVSSKVIRWYRYSLPYLYNFMLFHDISLKNEIFYQSEFCIRNSIKLNWCGHKKENYIYIIRQINSQFHNFQRKYCYFQVVIYEELI